MRNIATEHPDEHWPELNVSGRVVLDLGCGLFGFPVDWNTPCYFLRRGANRVVGVDFDTGGFGEIRKASNNDERLTLIGRAIESPDGLRDLLRDVTPTVVKCDIEGAEKHFDGLTSEDMAGVCEIAIEYHDAITKEICERKLSDWEFDVTPIQLAGHSLERIGVLYACRTSGD